MPDRFGAIPEVHLFLLNDDRLLLLRRCNTDYENGNYSVIAGGVEADEEVTAAAIREASEEVGIDVRLADIDVVGVIHRKGADGVVSVVFFLTARSWSGEIVNAEPWNHDEVSWHSVDNLPENMIAYVRTAFTNYRQGTFYDHVDWVETVPVQLNPWPHRFTLICDVYVFLIDDRGQVLLLNRRDIDSGDMSFSVIAGYVRADEEITDAALRRAKEELGIGILHRDLSVVGVMYRRSGDGRVSFFLAAPTWIGDIASARPDGCDDTSWHSPDDLPKNTIPYVRRALRNYQNGTFYEALGWEALPQQNWEIGEDS